MMYILPKADQDLLELTHVDGYFWGFVFPLCCKHFHIIIMPGCFKGTKNGRIVRSRIHKAELDTHKMCCERYILLVALNNRLKEPLPCQGCVWKELCGARNWGWWDKMLQLGNNAANWIYCAAQYRYINCTNNIVC